MTNALVQGASGGIGFAYVQHLLARPQIDRVFATCRKPEGSERLQETARSAEGRLRLIPCDIRDPASIAAMKDIVRTDTDRLDLLVNASGVLHDATGLTPERRFEHINIDHLQSLFAVNAFGPLLVAQHLYPLMTHGERATMVHLSARVGSIQDNQLGGWYGYRASKAALNQFVRTMAIELRRKSKQLICIAMHPGTVDTGLTKPFQRSAKVLFTPDDAVNRMMTVIDGLTPSDSGRFFAYDGASIEW